MGYALLAKDLLNAESPKDYHIVKIDNINCYHHNTHGLKDSISISINEETKEIKETTLCNRDIKSFNFDLYKNFFTFNEKNIYYYVNYEKTCFYFQTDKEACIFISIYIFKKACGTCMSSLFGN